VNQVVGNPRSDRGRGPSPRSNGGPLGEYEARGDSPGTHYSKCLKGLFWLRLTGRFLSRTDTVATLRAASVFFHPGTCLKCAAAKFTFPD